MTKPGVAGMELLNREHEADRKTESADKTAKADKKTKK